MFTDYKTIYFLQLKDFLYLVNEGTASKSLITTPYEIKYSATSSVGASAYDNLLIRSALPSSATSYKDDFYSTKEESIKLMAQYIAPAIWEKYLVRTENEEVDDNEDVIRFLYEVESFFAETYEYYKKLIDLYTSQSSNLLASLGYSESVSGNASNTETRDTADTFSYQNEQAHVVNKKSDMPQTTSAGSDNYLSEINDDTETKTGGHKVEADGTITNAGSTSNNIIHTDNVAIINRLNDIKEMLARLYKDWANEFINRFVIDIKE